jgi:hypothetical protein
MLHKCNVSAILAFTVDRQAALEPCRAPHLRGLEPRMARTCTPPLFFHPLPKFTSRQRTIIPWDSSTRTNPPPQICPLQASQKPTPSPPLYPMGVCFQPPAAMPIVQTQQLTEQARRFNQQKVAVFRSVFGLIRGHFAPFLAFFGGVAEVRSRRDNAIAEHNRRSTPRRKATRFGIELPQLADLHLQRGEVHGAQSAGGGNL